MMHTIRLLQTADQILSKGSLNIRVSDREELLAIKAGVMEYDALLQMSDALMESIEKKFVTSYLPERPNIEKIEAILVDIRTTLYH
jgi:hypothetical protein